MTLERLDGGFERLGICPTLLQAHQFKHIYDPSPLVVAGLHRLLTAIAQAAFNPQKNADLKQLWRSRRFPAEGISAFEKRYADRFDLFSKDAPFLQSADLALRPNKGDPLKAVTYLTVEMPAGSEITHYYHLTEDAAVFCPACAASALATIPAFATSGGAGIKPSINGVPPIYVLPVGQSLFESLAASLLTPGYQPEVASTQQDEAWWVRRPLVEKAREVHEVGYLHSLTFPARRVRLHPERVDTLCARCGQVSSWGVRTMVFEMGESRSKEAAFWFDPFVAYKLPTGAGKDKPVPIRPTLGKSLWREYAGLFLQAPSDSTTRTRRPRMLDQIAELDLTLSFRCVGVCTDMKAKTFEWIEAHFDPPHALLGDFHAGLLVGAAVEFASACAAIIAGVFRDEYGGRGQRGGGSGNKTERCALLKTRMLDDYWAVLAAPFRAFILALAGASFEQRETEMERWAERVVCEALEVFKRAADFVGDDAASLRRRVQAEHTCRAKLLGHKKKC